MSCPTMRAKGIKCTMFTNVKVLDMSQKEGPWAMSENERDKEESNAPCPQICESLRHVRVGRTSRSCGMRKESNTSCP